MTRGKISLRPDASGLARTADGAWQILPRPVKDGAKKAWLAYARLTSESRRLPDYLIIGAQRCGTSSLYNYLVRHPAIARALTKEVRYFDLHYVRGEQWYRSRFPSAGHRKSVKRRIGMDLVVGEASPDYIFHPHVPERVARLIPETKLIVLLRNPVERAYSHYWHQVSRGFETLSFGEAVQREAERLAGEFERMLGDQTYVSFNRHHFSYLTRGAYADQLAWWLERFPRDRILVMKSEAIHEDHIPQVRQILDFLGVPELDLGPYPLYGSLSSGTMTAGMRRVLEEYFRPLNRRLAELLGRDFGWDTAKL